MKRDKSVSAHLNQFPPAVKRLLSEMRATIHRAAPRATEKMSYGVATFVYFGNLVHYSAFKTHLSFFPGASGVKAFKRELSQYPHSKGTIQFAFDKPLPKALITRIVKFRVQENAGLPSLGAPAVRALASIKVKDLNGLTKVTEKKVRALHGFGPKALRTLKVTLKKHGLKFKAA